MFSKYTSPVIRINIKAWCPLLKKCSNENYHQNKLKQTRQISYFWEIWIILSVLNIDYSGFPSCVQDQWDVKQEEASRKETDRIQNPCAKHSFPSHRQGTSGTLLVAITLAQNWTHICNNLRSLSEVIQWCNNCFLFCFVLYLLFSTFGDLKTVRLPKKATGSGSHRGFGFIDFITKQDAKVCVSSNLPDILWCKLSY